MLIPKRLRLGQVGPAYRAVDAHAAKRLCQWMRCKHRTQTGKYMHCPDAILRKDLGQVGLAEEMTRFPWAQRMPPWLRAECGNATRPVRGAGRRNEAMRETEASAIGGSGPANG